MYGGYTEVARELEKRYGKPFTRQQVFVWHVRRKGNGFPSRITFQGKKVFSIPAIFSWYDNYKPSKGGRPRREEG